MNKLNLYVLILFSVFNTALSQQNPVIKNLVTVKNIDLFDHERSRSVPIAIYKSAVDSTIKNQQLIIFSHGYYENKKNSNMKYSYLTNFLASKGYFVVSIQHELPTDNLIPTTGIPQIVRRPFWERGAETILFAINKLKKSTPELDFNHINVIGHSNGADMTALFAQKYPSKAYKIITLDNRRMALPKRKNPKIYSLRSSDQPADEGVLPTVKEQNKYGITIVKLPYTIHNNMDDRGSDTEHDEIVNYISTFLKD
ncbi:alpha/beta hydrolase family protein [Flavobacterium algicola]|uniref:alpha/beta hydrolase family protein n=1 Tax=Flavobacterium algicola TaxID=556529 RepID=UPI001EFE9A25|nr:alpha/beta hydrolase [Flavobacterium algicola]MCG9792456.1 alpha/beta hydrolase [Flavobacterium algicola]